MNAQFAPVIERYNYLNQYVAPGQVLFFGSSYLDQFPLYELKEDYGLDQTLFKRSVPGLHIHDAFELLDVCVFNLMPSKLFVSLGDDDLAEADFSLTSFMAQYRKLLIKIREQLPKCEIYLMGIHHAAQASQINPLISELAHDYQCEFIETHTQHAAENFTTGCQAPSYIEDFRHIKVFLHPRRISFSDAWNAAI